MSCVCLWWCDNKGACAKNFVRILGKWPYTRVFSCVYRLSYVFLYGVYIEIGSYIFLLFCLHFFHVSFSTFPFMGFDKNVYMCRDKFWLSRGGFFMIIMLHRFSIYAHTCMCMKCGKHIFIHWYTDYYCKEKCLIGGKI